MSLKRSLESAELQFKQILEDFFTSVYVEKSLSSHGIDHHHRVWNNAKELLSVKFDHDSELQTQFSLKLIIACYLHDIGMSVDSGIRHGKHSRKLCIDFLLKNNLPLREYEDLLETIENHDRKEYEGNREVGELLTILSVADDLDAFGFSGIYRYSEIYLIRGIKPELIGVSIIENAGKRFDHFMKNFGYNNSLVQKHSNRFDTLIRFFSGYNKQVPSYRFDGQHLQGFCGVMEIFIQMIKNKNEFNEIYSEQEKYPDDQVIQWFIDGLKTDIE